MKKTLLKVELELEITDEDIDNIMARALEGGVNHWCSKAQVVGDYLGEYASEQISRGGKLNLYDGEDHLRYTLDKEKFMEDLKKFIGSRGVGLFDKKYSGKLCIDTCLLDADDADCIIQYALFDEVFYS